MIDALAGFDIQGIELARHAAVGIVGLGSLAALAVVIAAVAYRRATTRSIPLGAAVLVGLLPGAVWTISTSWSAGAPLRELALAAPANASYVIVTLVVGATVAVGGRRLGDRIGCELYGITPIAARDGLGSLVTSARRTVAVDLPEEIVDLSGYRSVDRSTKRTLAGRSLRFPRRCSTAALESRLERRLTRDFAVDVVDATLATDGSVTSLAVGRRRAGLGPTIPPETVAIAIRADPPAGAAPGDPVEVWEDAEASRLVATGTLRATAGDVATIVVDEADAEAFGFDGNAGESTVGTDGTDADQSAVSTDGTDATESADGRSAGESYRLVTRADRPSDAPRLLSVLRGATESVASVTVEAGGPFDGEFVGWLPGTVLLIDRDGERLPFPDDSIPVRAGDRIWVLGGPSALQRCEARELAEAASVEEPSAALESST